MKTTRFTDEQIIAFLKQAIAKQTIWQGPNEDKERRNRQDKSAQEHADSEIHKCQIPV